MATKTRVYRWRDRLIEATHPSHVIAHIAAEMDAPRVATQADLLELLPKGTQVETVRPVQAEIPTQQGSGA